MRCHRPRPPVVHLACMMKLSLIVRQMLRVLVLSERSRGLSVVRLVLVPDTVLAVILHMLLVVRLLLMLLVVGWHIIQKRLTERRLNRDWVGSGLTRHMGKRLSLPRRV